MAEREIQPERIVPMDYPSNAKSRPVPVPDAPKREARERVTSAPVKRRSSFADRMKESFGASTGQGFIEYILTDILISAAKSMIYDTVRAFFDAGSDGVERALYGDTRSRARQGRTQHTNYNRVTQANRPVVVSGDYGQRQISAQTRARHEFQNVVIASRGEAEKILDNLMELIEQYGQCTVADFYDYCGITSSFVDENWGWNDLRNAQVRPVRGGYIISLPRTVPIAD